MTSNLNTVCPYFTMFPLEFPLRVLHNQRGWIFDPFCGRGTTNFAARLKGLHSVGIDSSPVAIAIAEAKLLTSTPKAVTKIAREILKEARPPKSIPHQPFWKAAYNEGTLIEICRIREELIRDCSSAERKILRAIMLGALHGPRNKGVPAYFSNQSPRTFAPKPSYALKFWRRYNMIAPTVQILNIIEARAERFLSLRLPNVKGLIVQGDSREWISSSFKGLFSLIITSPPYYGMRMYIPDQWLRYWFVGGSSEVEYGARSVDFEHSSTSHFSAQLRQVWRNAAVMSKSDARLVCRFGGIHNRRYDCVEILKSSLRDSGWKLSTIRNAGSALNGKRQAAQFGRRQRQQPRQEYDAYAVRSDD